MSSPTRTFDTTRTQLRNVGLRPLAERGGTRRLSALTVHGEAAQLEHKFGHARAWTVTLTFGLFFVVAYVASGRARTIARPR